MCGIAGIIDFTKNSSEQIIKSMVQTLSNRGPDDCGCLVFEEKKSQVMLAHRRLSIVDLSNKAHQPMSYDGWHITYNGEIYNFDELKKSLILKNYTFESESDTEVVLKAFHCWGVKCVDKFSGMFAIAAYDENNKKIHLIRDKIGIKPLYVYQTNDLWLFASELKPFSEHHSFKKVINTDALANYFRFGYVRSPLSIFENVHKIIPGSYWTIDALTGMHDITTYWSIDNCYSQKKAHDNESEIIVKLKEHLERACLQQTKSNVPIGIWLSGGIDSSLVTALLKDTPNIKTFSMGFSEENLDEANYAQEVAKYLGVDNSTVFCKSEDISDVVKKLPTMFDEPFGDSSAIPTYLLAKYSKNSIGVAISGDGGDEVFFGYSKYFAIAQVLKWSKFKKYWLRHLFNLVSPNFVNIINKILPVSYQQKNIKQKYIKFKQLLKADGIEQMLYSASSYVSDEVLNEILLAGANRSNFKDNHVDRPLEQIQKIDFTSFMVDDILTKVDRASMFCSLEVRVPLLDVKVVELVASLPMEIKYKNRVGKYLLKKVLATYLPEDMMSRPKSGFQVPLLTWLQTDLQSLLDHYLDPKRLIKSGLYNVDGILYARKQIKEGDVNYVNIIWFVLMFEMWFEQWMQ